MSPNATHEIDMLRVSVCAPVYNEVGNIEEFYNRILTAVAATSGVELYEIVFIDNASIDGSEAVMKRLARQDRRVKVIFNVRNFGHIRSPFYGLLQCTGDCVVMIASDLEDPPELIPEMLSHWKSGAKVVAAVKRKTEQTLVLGAARGFFYYLMEKISDEKVIRNFTGFGVYDREVIAALRSIDDPYPYFRGLISELGWPPVLVPFDKPARKHGATKNNFFTLYDMAILGIVKHSKAPIRLAAIGGFLMSALSLSLAIGYFIIKLLFWPSLPLGVAPLLIGLFFFSSLQLFFIGLMGEYIGSIHGHVRRLPLVIEKERVNFASPELES